MIITTSLWVTREEDKSNKEFKLWTEKPVFYVDCGWSGGEVILSFKRQKYKNIFGRIGIFPKGKKGIKKINVVAGF